MNGQVRVLGVDPHQIALLGIESFIKRSPGIEFVGGAADFDAALSLIEQSRPSIVLADLPAIEGCSFAKVQKCLKQHRGLDLIIHTACMSDFMIEEASRIGARGFVCKSDSVTCLREAIAHPKRAGMYLSPVARRRVENPYDPGKLRSKFSTITPRERDVLRMIGMGMSRVQIAATLQRSIKTVDSHRASVMEKLGVENRVQLALLAVREGLVEV